MSYTPGSWRVGVCTKCMEPVALQMPDEANVDVDRLLDTPRECPGYHVELSGFGTYFWPWRGWPEFLAREEAIAFKRRLFEDAELRARLMPHHVREAIARGRSTLRADGHIETPADTTKEVA